MHIDETKLSPDPTFAASLAAVKKPQKKPVGYRVGFFGKYLNISPRHAPAGAHTYFVNPGPAAESEYAASTAFPSRWPALSRCRSISRLRCLSRATSLPMCSKAPREPSLYSDVYQGLTGALDQHH